MQRLVSIEGIRLYGHFYMKHRFNAGVNIIYGHNGGGKTTMLNILANALMGDFRRFAHIEFANINIEFDDNTYLEMYRNYHSEGEEYIEVKLNDELIWTDTINHAIQSLDETIKPDIKFPPATYFPAYRNLYDYLALSQEEQSEKLLSPFAPPIQFPSMSEIEEVLKGAASITGGTNNIQTFIDIVNRFYENKKLVINNDSIQNPFQLRYTDKHVVNSLTSLSSGERQITAIFYAISKLKSQGIVLMDEPEISLHLDWQRKILRSFSRMSEASQIITCTHSPAIAGDFEMQELEFRFVS